LQMLLYHMVVSRRHVVFLLLLLGMGNATHVVFLHSHVVGIFLN